MDEIISHTKIHIPYKKDVKKLMLIYKAKKLWKIAWDWNQSKEETIDNKKTEIGDKIKKKYKSMDKIKYI